MFLSKKFDKNKKISRELGSMNQELFVGQAEGPPSECKLSFFILFLFYYELSEKYKNLLHLKHHLNFAQLCNI